MDAQSLKPEIAGSASTNGSLQRRALHRRAWTRAAWIVAAALSGCGPRQPALHPVTGQVLFEGRPAARFAVEFSSQEAATKGVSAIGVADKEGRFTLETRQAGRQKPGAVAGAHRIVVIPPPGLGDDKGPVLPVPLRYADYTTSKLSAEVKAEQDNTVTLELKR